MGLFTQAQTDVQGEQGGQTWTGNVNVTGDITVKTGTLNIEAGTTITFDGFYRITMDEQGVIKALGTEADSIRFQANDANIGWNGIQCYNFFGSMPAENEETVFDYCVFTDSKKTGEDYVDKYGGLISIRSWDKIEFKNTRISKCSSAENGGVVFVNSNAKFTDCLFSNNATQKCGAVAYITEQNSEWNNCTFKGNHSESTGGAVYALIGGTFNECKFVGNESLSSGGAIYLGENTVVTHCTFEDNYSKSGGGAAYLLEQGKLTDCKFEFNRTDGAGGGLLSGSPETISNCEFNFNTSKQEGAGAYINGNGSITNSIFIMNSTETNGGGLACRTIGDDGGNVEVKYCEFLGNEAKYNGGAMYMNGTVNADYVSMTNNTATSGGGLYGRGEAIAQNALIFNNKASMFGGGTNTKDGAKVINSTIANNEGTMGGGAIYNSGAGTYSNCVIWGCGDSPISTYGEGFEINNCAIQGTFEGGNKIIFIEADNMAAKDDLLYPAFIEPSDFVGVAETDEQVEALLETDWGIMASSALINLGDDAYINSKFDRKGLRRKNGIVDIGAYEYNHFEMTIDYINETTAEALSADFEVSTDITFTTSTVGDGNPAALEAGKVHYFRFAETAPGVESPVFALNVDPRDKAPNNPVENDDEDTFGFDLLADFSNMADYEYSVDNGENWTVLDANPIVLENKAYAAGSIQVRLKASDADGAERFHGEALVSTIDFTLKVGLEEMAASNGIYPNPTTNGVFVDLNEDAKVAMINANGQMIFEVEAEMGKTYISTNGLDAGLYMIKVTNDEASQVFKLIVK